MSCTKEVLVTARFFDEASAHALHDGGYRVSRGGIAKDAVDQLISDEMRVALARASAWIAGIPPVTRALLQACPDLEVIARRGVGYDTIDVVAIRDLGRVLTVTPGCNEATVADHAVGLMLSVGKNFMASHRRMQAGQSTVVVGTELFRKTVGLLGFGRIARQVAQRLRGFEARLIAHDPFPDEDCARTLGVEYVGLNQLLGESDFISLHAPLSGETRHLMNARTLGLLKPGAILINTARGELVDDAALLAALEAGRLAGAGLDVLGSERNLALEAVTRRLLALPNVLCTQHTGGSSAEGLRRANQLAAQCVMAVLEGRPVPPGCIVVDGRRQ